MNLLNKESEAITNHKVVNYVYAKVSTDRAFFISYNAVSTFGFMLSKYFHFIEDEGKLYMFQDTNPQGFLPHRHMNRGNTGFILHSVALVLHLQKKYKIKRGDRLRLSKSGKTYEGNKLIEIILEK